MVATKRQINQARYRQWKKLDRALQKLGFTLGRKQGWQIAKVALSGERIGFVSLDFQPFASLTWNVLTGDDRSTECHTVGQATYALNRYAIFDRHAQKEF